MLLIPKAVTREIDKAQSRAESPFEEEVIKRLVSARYQVTPQWKVGRYRIDLVVQDGEKKLAVECDGDRFHPPEKLAEDMGRQTILERLGWRFHPIRGTEFFGDPDSAMDRLFSRLQSLEIYPVADSESETNEPSSDALTDEVIRRAAELRYEWKTEDHLHEPEKNNDVIPPVDDEAHSATKTRSAEESEPIHESQLPLFAASQTEETKVELNLYEFESIQRVDLGSTGPVPNNRHLASAASKVVNAGFHNGIRSYADAVAHAATVFGDEKIHALHPYLRGGWEELRRREGDEVEAPNYAAVLDAYRPQE